MSELIPTPQPGEMYADSSRINFVPLVRRGQDVRLPFSLSYCVWKNDEPEIGFDVNTCNLSTPEVKRAYQIAAENQLRAIGVVSTPIAVDELLRAVRMQNTIKAKRELARLGPDSHITDQLYQELWKAGSANLEVQAARHQKELGRFGLDLASFRAGNHLDEPWKSIHALRHLGYVHPQTPQERLAKAEKLSRLAQELEAHMGEESLESYQDLKRILRQVGESGQLPKPRGTRNSGAQPISSISGLVGRSFSYFQEYLFPGIDPEPFLAELPQERASDVRLARFFPGDHWLVDGVKAPIVPIPEPIMPSSTAQKLFERLTHDPIRLLPCIPGR